MNSRYSLKQIIAGLLQHKVLAIRPLKSRKLVKLEKTFRQYYWLILFWAMGKYRKECQAIELEQQLKTFGMAMKHNLNNHAADQPLQWWCSEFDKWRKTQHHIQ
jgi:hypothetical protein